MLNLRLVFKFIGGNLRGPRGSNMMRWALVFAAACVMLGTPAQPTACVDDAQCISGYYCQLDVLSCRECLHCEDLNRQPPATAVSCIRSVTQCGPCLKGFVEDRVGDVDAGCTLPVSPDAPLPAYVIVIIVMCLLIFALVVIALVYVLRHKDTFKILASTRTSVQTPVVAVGAMGAGPAPSAPTSPPPPYHEAAHYDPLRPVSPPHSLVYYQEEGHDASAPLVKRAAPEEGGSGADGAGGSGGAREAAGSQAARVYDPPVWVRNAGPLPMPSYNSALSDDAEAETGFVPHDEDTMESTWTPAPAPAPASPAHTHTLDAGDNEASASETANGASHLSLALRRPSRSEAISPPPKMIRLSSGDSNNNHNSGSSGPPSPPTGAAPAAPTAPASFIINVLNVNALHKIDDVTL